MAHKLKWSEVLTSPKTILKEIKQTTGVDVEASIQKREFFQTACGLRQTLFVKDRDLGYLSNKYYSRNFMIL